MFKAEEHLAGGQQVGYLLMSSDHLSLCSSELRKSEEAQSVEISVKACVCLLCYATHVCSFGACSIISPSLSAPGYSRFYQQELQWRLRAQGFCGHVLNFQF